jgi:hypothetical protein
VSRSPGDAPYTAHLGADGALVLPVWFVYPQHGVSDIVAAFGEDSAFGAHLDAVFPPGAPAPAFDPAGAQYTSAGLAVYATTRRRRVLKVGRKTTLRELLAKAAAPADGPPDGIEMKDGCLSFVVVPKGEVERQWIDEYKSERG